MNYSSEMCFKSSFALYDTNLYELPFLSISYSSTILYHISNALESLSPFHIRVDEVFIKLSLTSLLQTNHYHSFLHTKH